MSQIQSEQSPSDPFPKAASLNAPSKFHQLETRVKIKSDTYIQFDGTDHVYLKNVVCEDAIRIKYDILLILYDIVSWSTIGDLIEPWPPDDQLKIMDTLEKLYEGKVILVDDQGESELSGENKLPDTLGNHIHINVENHHAMLRDYVRLAAYRRAIEHSVSPETIAMDLGCGSGILSFFLAQAGAKKIYAIEKRPDIILLAEELAKNNGYEQIQFCSGTSSQMDASQFDPKPTVLVSEILGNGILEENVLEFTLDARDRFLAPNGKMIPSKLEIYVFAFDSGLKHNKWQEVEEFKDLYGVDFTVFGQVLCSKATLSLDRYNTLLNKTMSAPALAKSLDFNTLESPMFQDVFNLKIEESGSITGFCAYFKAYLDEEKSTTLTNSPWAPQTHWTQLLYTLPAPQAVEKEQLFPLQIIYDGSLRIRLSDS